MRFSAFLFIFLWGLGFGTAWADGQTPVPTVSPTPVAVGATPRPMGAPSATATRTHLSDLIQSVAPTPETSSHGQPIQFQAVLARPASLHLSIYTLTGELVYQADQAGQAGANSILWNLTNQAKQLVNGDVYIYLIQANDGVSPTAQTGRVLVIP